MAGTKLQVVACT